MMIRHSTARWEFLMRKAIKCADRCNALVDSLRMRDVAQSAMTSAYLVPAGGDVRKAWRKAYSDWRELVKIAKMGGIRI